MNFAITVILNKGGMKDVALNYIKYFESNDVPGGFLFIFFDKNIIEKKVCKKNIIFIEDPSLGKVLSNIDDKEMNKKCELMIRQKGIETILVDYFTYRYFKNLNISFIADIHYLMRSANRIQRPKHKIYENSNIEKFQNIYARDQIFKEKLELDLINRAKRILCNSISTYKDVHKLYNQNFSQLVVVNVGQLIQSSFSLSKDAWNNKSLFYAGRFNSLKRVDYLIDLAEKYNLQIDLYGANKRIQLEIEKLGSKQINTFNWINSDIEKIMSRYLFHVFPSMYEPFGLSLNKSLKMGAVCLANSEASGHKEQIIDGENGFLVDFSLDKTFEKISAVLKMEKIKLKEVSSTAKASTSQNKYVESVLDIICN